MSGGGSAEIESARMNIAHDVNNLLGVALAYARFIAEDAEPGSQSGKYAARIVQAVRHAESLLSQLGRGAPVRSRGSVLIVADSTQFGDELMAHFSALGYEPAVCDDPGEAIGFLHEDPSAWDLLITEQNTVTMSGWQLIEQAKLLRPDLPCILCGDGVNDLTGGAEALISLPAQPDEIAIIATQTLERVRQPRLL